MSKDTCWLCSEERIPGMDGTPLRFEGVRDAHGGVFRQKEDFG